jgi:hypothetical protein
MRLLWTTGNASPGSGAQVSPGKERGEASPREIQLERRAFTTVPCSLQLCGRLGSDLFSVRNEK